MQIQSHAIKLFLIHFFASALAFFLFQRYTEFITISLNLHLSFPLIEMFYLQIFS